MSKFLITVVGPTAIGKTSLAIKLAQHFGCEILSCDSRQFYREMQIGTAVPDATELASAKHHFIQHLSIHDRYSVGDFEKDAIAKLTELFTKNDFAILVGGSGLYVDAVLNGLDTFPDVDDVSKAEVRQNYDNLGIAYLQETLKSLDPVYFQNVDSENPQRMMRAIEVCIASKKPYSTFLNKQNIKRGFVPILIGLESPRAELYAQINRRVDLMVDAGLIEEAQNLLPFRKQNALQTVGYRELFSYFDSDFTKEFAISEIKKNTRRFAKRQMTWFKRNEKTKWFDRNEPLQNITKFIKNLLEKK